MTTKASPAAAPDLDEQPGACHELVDQIWRHWPPLEGSVWHKEVGNGTVLLRVYVSRRRRLSEDSRDKLSLFWWDAISGGVFQKHDDWLNWAKLSREEHDTALSLNDLLKGLKAGDFALPAPGSQEHTDLLDRKKLTAKLGRPRGERDGEGIAPPEHPPEPGREKPRRPTEGLAALAEW